MRRDRDITDFPPGTRVRTPLGRCGVVERVRGRHSRRDHFERVVVRLGPEPRDTVTLQPALLELDHKSPEAATEGQRIDA